MNTAAASQAITVTARIADSPAGFAMNALVGEVRFYSPSGSQFADASFYYSRDAISGTATDATFRVTMTVPQFAEVGTWTANNFLLSDQLRNTVTLTTAQLVAAGFPTTFRNGP